MHRAKVLILMLCLSASACAGNEPFDPTEVARAVEATLKAYATPESLQPMETARPAATPTTPSIPAPTTIPVPTNTPAPTGVPTPIDTPIPSPTPIPSDTPTAIPTDTATATPTSSATSTPVPTPTAAAAVPADWVVYQDIVGQFSFSHPPGWELDDQRAGWVAFRPESYAMVGVKTEPNADVRPRGEDDESSLNSLVERAAARPDQLRFRVLDKGLWDNTGFFVMHTATHPSLDVTDYTLEVAIPIGSANTATLVCSRAFNPIPDAWIEDFHVLLATLDVPGGTIRRATPVPSPTRAPGEAPTGTVNSNCNLRQGPGTNYGVSGNAQAGDIVELLGRNEAADWLHVKAGGKLAWVAAFLVLDGDLGELPVQQSTAPTVTVAPPTATRVPRPRVGQEVEGGGWRFKVSEVHKRKAVYFYDYSYIAQGNFLIVVIDAVNIQSGTDYFANNLDPWVVDMPGNVYNYQIKASGYAQWQLGGLSSPYTDVNPGNFVRIAMAFDIPPDRGQLLLSTDVLIWIDLGDFSTMPLEK
jgi:uncharacterized protein YraI